MTKEKDATHIGIIMDGNRRFAKKLMLNPSKGHEWGAKKVTSLLEWCKDTSVRELTLYTFSLENFNRPKDEFNYLMALFKKEFDKLKDDPRIEEHDIRIRIIGRTHLLPDDVQESIRAIMAKTKDNSGYIINFALSYGGQAEIVDAAKELAKKVERGLIKTEDIDNKAFENELYMRDQPDLIIRTGGDRRTSNFLCYQSAYSEWFFLDKMWPDFEKEDLQQVLQEFKDRDRRFGH